MGIKKMSTLNNEEIEEFEEELRQLQERNRLHPPQLGDPKTTPEFPVVSENSMSRAQFNHNAEKYFMGNEVDYENNHYESANEGTPRTAAASQALHNENWENLQKEVEIRNAIGNNQVYKGFSNGYRHLAKNVEEEKRIILL